MTREEALKKVRQMSLPKETMEILEALAPELKESEDERIRRTLVEYFGPQAQLDFIRGVPIKKIRDWLEKQKECVSNNFDDVWNEEDCEDIIAEGQKLTPRFKELLKEVCHAWYDRGAKLEKQKEQKHPDGCFTCGEYKKGYEAGRLNGFTAGYNKAMKEQKPIEMEVYEVGKGTTICGQDYKCKKDYQVGNCKYIKDAIYHCGRDGYLTDQNGVSWSCTPEWFKEYIQSNTEWAEEEKTRFVSEQFLQCKLSFDGFKEGEHYWLEYIGDDMYVGRSDNILNQKFHITPRQLYTLFSQKLEEVQGPPQEEKQASLTYEPPFNENASDKEIIEALIKHLKEQDGFLTAINCVSTKAILSWLKKQKEQKSEEWSEEEKRKLNRIYSIIGWAMDEHAFSSCKKLLGDKEGIELQDFLRSIAKPKQEWSEEDEERLKAICTYLRDYPRLAKLGDKLRFNEYCDFLKSLRPSWKPNEEQKEALEYVIRDYREDGCNATANYLQEVLDHLKNM